MAFRITKMNNQNNINHLPNDLMSLILSIRTEEMKKDKQIKENKEKYNNFVNSFKENIYILKDDILRDSYGTKGLYKEVMDGDDCMWEDCKKVLDKWELWDIDFNILTPVSDEDPFNNLNYM